MSDTVRRRLTAEQAALLTAYLVHCYQIEKGKQLTRFRLSRGSVRYLGLRATLREAFTEEWAEALAGDWGWLAFTNGEEFGLIRADAVAGWIRLGTKRVAGVRKTLRGGDFSVLDDLKAELEQAAQDAEEEEDEEG